MAHVHAELMRQYAEDWIESPAPWKNWQTRPSPDCEWKELCYHPEWMSSVEYRRKPRTIRIGEYDVPEPMREAPEERACYFFPTMGRPDNPLDLVWRGDEMDLANLDRGLCHSTREAAELHAKALISLTGNAW